MINLKDEKTLEVINELKKIVGSKARKNDDNYDDSRYILENRLILTICSMKFDAHPKRISEVMKIKYNYDLEVPEIITLLKDLRIGKPSERRDVFFWAHKMEETLEKALQGDKSSFYKIYNDVMDGNRNRSRERVLMLMIYYRLPLGIVDDTLRKIEKQRNVIIKYILLDLLTSIKNTYSFLENDMKEENKAEENKEVIELQRRVSILEEKLNRTEEMHQELQEEFEDQLQESKIIEMTNFFAKLNSEKYGCILDQLIECRDGMSTLKKKKFELPLEINGLFVMTKNLAKFTQDSHIAPIMKPDEIKNVKLSDIEFCQYEGTEFKDEDEIKQIIVISPGWIYRDKEIQISRPKVREVEQND